MNRVLALAILLGRLAAGQIVEGTVTNSITGEGIPGVRVDLAQGGDLYYSATTDAQGRFLFDHAQNGLYMAIFTAKGYDADPIAPRQFQVTAGGNPLRLDQRMAPLGGISGRVVDGRGQAVPKAGVGLIGTRQRMLVQTDAQGKFEVLQKLLAGNYIVTAAPPADLPPPDPDPETGRRTNWVRTWFPATPAPDGAASILVTPGGEASGIEVKLLTAPSHAVRGVLLNPEGKPAAKTPVSLDSAMGSMHADTQADGSFEFPSVVAGEWNIWAEQPASSGKLRGEQLVEVGERDVEGVQLQLAAAFTVRGKITVEMADGKPGPRIPIVVGLEKRVSRTLRESGLAMGPAPGSPTTIPDAQGNFVLANVFPGAYHIRVFSNAPGFYLDSVRLGDLEPRTRELEVASGAAALTATFKSGGGSVRGALENCSAGFVTLVPQDDASRATGFFQRSVLCNAASAARGQYAIDNVRPGDYYLVAYLRNDSDPRARSLPDDLDPSVLAQAAKITVRAGEAASVDLRAITLPGQ